MAPLNASLNKESGFLDSIAALLSGQKICDAAALATAAGTIRLAVVIIQVALICTFSFRHYCQQQSASILVLTILPSRCLFEPTNYQKLAICLQQI